MQNQELISQNKAIVIRFNKEFLEQGKAEVLNDIVADGFINHTTADGIPNNVEGLKLFVATIHKGFSKLRVDIHKQIAEKDVVATRKTIYATHTGEIMAHQATGKQVAFHIMDFVRLRDGKYIEHWGQNNVIQVIKEL